MKKVVKVFDRPGMYEVTIPYGRRGMEQEWVGIVDARAPGVYTLRVTADHTALHTTGRVTVRGVAGAKVVLNVYGMIKIRKAAQQTDDFLELRVLTLDASARVIAEPQLEIEAHDVKASHAASVGPISTEQLLYLQSHGLTIRQATDILVSGFLAH